MPTKSTTPKLTGAKLSTGRLLFILVLATLLPRLYRIDNPAADWHAFRQADTASVTREYLKNGLDLLHPRYQDLSNIQSGLDNLEGWRMVEFPLVNGLGALLTQALPLWDVVLASRWLSVIFSIGTTLSLYYLVKRISGPAVAFLSGLSFALLPFAIFYGRAVLPEPAMLFFSTASLWLFGRYLDNKQKWLSFLTSALFLALALLLKPFVAFLAPVYLTLAWQKFGKKLVWHWELGLFVAAAFAPLIWWREWIAQFPSGIPANDWLFNSNQIRLRPAWWRWLFYERLTLLILGVWGWLLVVANLNQFKKKRAELAIYGSWGVGLMIYLIVIATGNVQHDYYQVIALPLVAALLGRGAWLFYQFWRKKLGANSAQLATSMIFVLTLIFSWQKVSGYFNINHWEYIEAGQVVDQLTPPDAKVIAPAFGDTIFLFQTNRTGWPIGFEIEDKIEKGATHYVTTSYDDEARLLEKEYQTLAKTERYLLLDLTKPLITD